MISSVVVAASLAFSAGPMYETPGEGYGPVSNGRVSEFGYFDGAGFGGQLYPFDGQEPWLHGYFQEIPAYGGYNAFRPYNYKHVLSQSQTAAGWGMQPTMPYSQQFWHRYHAPATMSPATNAEMGSYSPPRQQNYAPVGYQAPMRNSYRP